MHLCFFIARRYLFSHKQKTVVNIISWISLVGIAVSTTALVVVLSVYNGIGNLTQSLFNSFDPPLLVQPAQGKTFHADDIPLEQLRRIDGVAALSCIVEENAWVTHRHNQAIVALRGVDAEYPSITGLDTLLHEGVYGLKAADADGDSQSVYFLLFGAEVYHGLGLRQATNVPVAVHIPKRGVAMGMTVDQALNTAYAYPGGNFYIQQDIDSRYVVADIGFVRRLMGYAPDECSAIAISLRPGVSPGRAKKAARELLGHRYTVKDRFEQQPIYYKIFRSERLGIYIVLALIVLISSLNLVASLSLMLMDKRRDMSTLRNMGMPQSALRRIFRIEGVMVSAVGVVAGLLLGFIICFVQQRFGIVKMGDNFIVSAFPVVMRGLDFLFTFLLVMAISTVAVFLTVNNRHLRPTTAGK